MTRDGVWRFVYAINHLNVGMKLRMMPGSTEMLLTQLQTASRLKLMNWQKMKLTVNESTWFAFQMICWLSSDCIF